MKAAVVAHYDPDCVWDENFLIMLRILNEVVDHIIVVTTSTEITELLNGFRHISVVRRPNVGYDFYSYRVGIRLAFLTRDYDELFVLNSTILSHG